MASVHVMGEIFDPTGDASLKGLVPSYVATLLR